MQAKLNLPYTRTHVADLPEVAVGNSVIRVAVTGDIEEVEEISAETKHMLFAPRSDVTDFVSGRFHQHRSEWLYREHCAFVRTSD